MAFFPQQQGWDGYLVTSFSEDSPYYSTAVERALGAFGMTTPQQLADKWDALVARAKKLSAPESALQDFYKAYAVFSVAQSAGVVQPNITQFENQANDAESLIKQLEAQYPKKLNIGYWMLGLGAAAAVYMWWDSKRMYR